MGSRHEVIKWTLISDWSVAGRGRLFCMNQGMAVPIGRDNPIWFGPLKRKFKGFPDLFGFELIEEEIRPIQYVVDRKTYPIFTLIEVKTRNDTIKKHQRRFLTECLRFGIRVYIAWEADNESGYELKEWNE